MDDILLEVRQSREAFAASHNFDVQAMVAYLRRQDQREDWPVVTRSPRPAIGFVADHSEVDMTREANHGTAGLR